MLSCPPRAEMPDRFAHGFLEASGLQSMNLGIVRCYQQEKYHTGFTIFSQDGQASVYVQMYKLPVGEAKMAEDLAFQVQGKGWGKPPGGESLLLKIFPSDWTYAVSTQSPKRIVQMYRGPDLALFIRYSGNSLRTPLFFAFNDHLMYLNGKWHTELVNQEYFVPPKSRVKTTAIVDALDLRLEQQSVRQMILEGLKRFASEQRVPGGDVHGLPVTGIVFGLNVENGYVSVHFDVRVPFQVDGSYSHEEFGVLTRENWRQFVDRFCDGHKVTLTGLNGKTIKMTPGSGFNLDEAFGLMLLNLVKTLQTERAFDALLLASDAELVIEADDAAFSWSSRDGDRGKENRV